MKGIQLRKEEDIKLVNTQSHLIEASSKFIFLLI